jgi:hypothetical protein
LYLRRDSGKWHQESLLQAEMDDNRSGKCSINNVSQKQGAIHLKFLLWKVKIQRHDKILNVQVTRMLVKTSTIDEISNSSNGEHITGTNF